MMNKNNDEQIARRGAFGWLTYPYGYTLIRSRRINKKLTR